MIRERRRSSEALRSSFFIIQIIMVLLVVVFFGSGFFTVKEQYKAIILRMGRPVGEGEGVLLGPGPHFAFPRPIDEVTNIPFSSGRSAPIPPWAGINPRRSAPRTRPLLHPVQSAGPRLHRQLHAHRRHQHHPSGRLRHLPDHPAHHLIILTLPTPPQFVTNDLNNALLFAASRFTVDDILSKQPDRLPGGGGGAGCANWRSSRPWASRWKGWIACPRRRGRC